MPIPPRTLLTLLPALTLSACFDPMVDPVDSGAAGSTDGSSSGTDPGSSGGATDGIADSTGPVDAPPELQAFTVNGSTAPAEQQLAGTIVFDVDAVDDVGIDRVEIYDGAELIATVESSPYVAQALVSSADNGSHAYTAVAVDTVGQTAESEVVPLSVNVVGGAVIELREDIGAAYSYAGFGAPRVATDASGNVIVTLSGESKLVEDFQLRALKYNSTLSLQWESTLSAMDTAVIPAGHPFITTGGELIVGTWQGAGFGEVALHRANAETGSALGSQMWGSNSAALTFPTFGQLSTGEILLSAAPHVLEARTEDLVTTLWTREQFPAISGDASTVRGIVGIDIDSAGNSLLTFIPSDPVCGSEGEPCIRKLSPDGTTLWTRPVAGGDNSVVPPARFDGTGRAISAWAGGDAGISVQVYDFDGTEVNAFETLAGGPLFLFDLDIDPQGNLIVAGGLDATAWAARLTPEGEVLWSRIIDELEPGPAGTSASGVAVTDDGRAYFTGISGTINTEFFSFEGSAWIAEISL